MEVNFDLDDPYISGLARFTKLQTTLPSPTDPLLPIAPEYGQPVSLTKRIADLFFQEENFVNPDRLAQLDLIQTDLDIEEPNNETQQALDDFAASIKDKFSELTVYTTWLRDNDAEKEWYTQLALHLLKLPLRAAQNIIDLLYNTIEAILFAAVHPKKGLCEAAKLIIKLLNALAQPETYTKIGAGILGAGLAQSIVPYNALSPISLILGGCLVFTGISVGAIKAAIEAHQDIGQAALTNFTDQLILIPEALLTGFFIGLMIPAYRQPPADGGEMHILPHPHPRPSMR